MSALAMLLRPIGMSPLTIFGCADLKSEQQLLKEAWRRKASETHPDRGGDAMLFAIASAAMADLRAASNSGMCSVKALGMIPCMKQLTTSSNAAVDNGKAGGINAGKDGNVDAQKDGGINANTAGCQWKCGKCARTIPREHLRIQSLVKMRSSWRCIGCFCEQTNWQQEVDIAVAIAMTDAQGDMLMEMHSHIATAAAGSSDGHKHQRTS